MLGFQHFWLIIKILLFCKNQEIQIRKKAVSYFSDGRTEARIYGEMSI